MLLKIFIFIFLKVDMWFFREKKNKLIIFMDLYILLITLHFLAYLFNKNILIKYYITCSMINLNSRVSAKVAK